MSANKPNRRQFLGTAGLVGAGAVLSSCAQVFGAPNKANLDTAILNFALNLEYLEAAFYLTAVGRLGELDAAGGSSAAITFNSNVGTRATDKNGTITNADLKLIVNEIATDEISHVKALRGALGSAAVSQPQLDLGPAFAAAGNVASGGAITNFDPYASDLFFLHGAFIFEDVGVTAYKGAAILTSDQSSVGGVLDTAAGILAVEAYHAGYIRTVLFQQRATPVTPSLNVAQVTKAISNLRAKVGNGKDSGVTTDGTATGGAMIVNADSNSIAYGRSTREVLNIVYLDATGAANKGGFFPNGLNGTIK